MSKVIINIIQIQGLEYRLINKFIDEISNLVLLVAYPNCIKYDQFLGSATEDDIKN